MPVLSKLKVMVSYNWAYQELAKLIARILKEEGINIWIDVDGGIVEGDINAAMAEGVESSAAIICLVSEKYELSKNCRKELSYADVKSKILFPVMVEANYDGKGWLGLILAGLLWTDFRRAVDVQEQESIARELAIKIKNRLDKETTSDDGVVETNGSKKIDQVKIFNDNFRGRAFRYVNEGRKDNSVLIFESLEHVYFDNSDDPLEERKHQWRRHDGGKVLIDDIKYQHFTKVEVLSEFIISCHISYNDIYWNYGSYENGVTTWDRTFELAPDLNSIIRKKTLCSNKAGDVVIYAVSNNGVVDIDDKVDNLQFQQQKFSFLLDEKRTKPQAEVLADIEKEKSLNENYILKYFEVLGELAESQTELKTLKSQLSLKEKECRSLKDQNKTLQKELAASNTKFVTLKSLNATKTK